MTRMKPKICIVEPNTLAVLGLKRLLMSVMPIAEVDAYATMNELLANNPEQYVHYFVAVSVLLEHPAFFYTNRRKTIVITTQETSNSLQACADYHCLCVDVPEPVLIRSLLTLEQHAHGTSGVRPIHPTPAENTPILTKREVEVMTLIVKGFINKEIAEKLHIALTTVISHRKNIMEKLGVKSVSALTIYAVTNDYVNINEITIQN